MTTTDIVVPYFVGRESLLATIDATLRRERVVALSGPSGIGKTATAREYVRRATARYQHVVWLNAVTPTVLLADCHDAMRRLKLPAGDPNLSPLQPLRDWLATQHGYLLVLDNAESPAALRTVIPAQQGGHVLLTTHHPLSAQAMTCLELDRLTTEEGAQVLLRQSGVTAAPDRREKSGDDQASAMMLAREMAGFPLALALAAGYITATGGSVADGLRAFRDGAHTLPGMSTDEAMRAVTVMVTLIDTHLRQHQPEAAAMLRMCLFFVPDAIALVLLVPSAVGAKTLTQMGLDDVALLKTLVRARIVSYQRTTHTLSLHPLVQAQLERALRHDEREQAQQHALAAILTLIPVVDTARLTTRLRLVAHIQRVVATSEQWTFTSQDAAKIFAWAATVLLGVEEHAAAVQLLKRAIAIWERTVGSDDPLVLAALHRLATLTSAAGDDDEAKHLLVRVIRGSARGQGSAHEDTILSLNSLGDVYAEQGQHDEAALTYERALALCERKHGTGHPLTVLIQHNLALAYSERDRFAAAEPLLRHVSAFYEKTLGPTAIETARALHLLANVCAQQEQWDQAEALYRRVLPIYEKREGHLHPDVVACLHQLMTLALQRHNNGEAQAIAQRILAIREEQVRQADSPEMVLSVYGLAGMYLGMGRVADAQKLLRRVLAICERFPEIAAPVRAIAHNCLATLHVQEGENDSAVASLQAMLRAWEDVLGAANPTFVDLSKKTRTLIVSLRQ